MTEPQVTMSGLVRLRQIANRMDLVDYEMAQEIRQMAELWEADLIHATGLIADETFRAERAELSLSILNDDYKELASDVAAFAGQNERLIKAAGAETGAGAIEAIKAQRAALERARALVARWKAEANPSEPALSASVVFLAHSMADELAAVLGS